MVLFRYLFKQIIFTLFGMAALFVLMFLGNEIVRLLARAAAGLLSLADVLPIMGILIPQVLGFLLPISLFFALILVYGRMYADNEMTVLQACGLSRLRLCCITMVAAFLVATLVAVIVMWLNPLLAVTKQQLLLKRGPALVMQSLAPGRFQVIDAKEHAVIFAQDKDPLTGELKQVFLAQHDKQNHDAWQILTADAAHLEEDEGQQFFVANSGVMHSNIPGTAGYRSAAFERLALQVNQQDIDISKKRQVQPMQMLWEKRNIPLYAAELHWRLAFPLMTLILALMAIPLSHVSPRQGRYAKIIPATMIMVAYGSLLLVGRDWLRYGAYPANLGLWWLHGIAFLVALVLLLGPNLMARWRYTMRAYA